VKILALDSSSHISSVAFVETGLAETIIRFRSDIPHRRADSSPLFNGLERAVATCGLPELICVGLGPGSYNGLRAGIAAARAFATALKIPLAALPSPLAVPPPASSSEGFWVVGDARGGHYWIACLENDSFLQEPRLLTPSEILEQLQTRPDFPILGTTPLAEIENLLIATPDAARLAILAVKSDSFATESTLTPEPIYLKPPHITAPKTLSA
jgi:tRNA threonylcarbamoyl adenosine modification protein YeaZ